MIHLDTHVLIWLYDKDERRLSADLRKLFEKNDLYISPMVLLELKFLFEIDRIKVKPNIIFDYLCSKIDLKIDNTSFIKIIDKAFDLTWTKDPFDRLIAAQAISANAKLVTKDKIILKNLKNSFWI